MKTNISILDNAAWEPPENSNLNFQFDIGDSILSEFILSHNLGAVIKELVQNEYDAKGQKLKVHFGHEYVEITGSGERINAQGWQRLSVVLGTGNTSNSNRNIKPKVNGIGSKNFGLRSLFLLGDTIYISSEGKQTVLDLAKGALPKPIKDDHSNQRKGVSIRVPYRTIERGKLKPFGLEQEREALNKLDRELTHTLIKLAQPDTKKNLKEVSIISERCNREFRWKQTVKTIPCKAKGVTAVHRKIRMSDSLSDEVRAIEELEFQKTYTLPQEFKDQNFPSYFKVKSNSIRLALSVRINKGKINVNEPGLFYYPLGVNSGFTGTAISISAPFQMDMDRSQLTDPENDNFNKWLLTTAAELTITLLVEDWYERFGFIVYHALTLINPPALSLYIDELNSKLKQAKCWATREKGKKSPYRTVFKLAQNLVIPESASLDGFLSSNQYLDEKIGADPILRKIAQDCGAKIFTTNSLVRLRCVGEDRTHLKTQMQSHEADYHYTDFNNQLTKESIQTKFAEALDLQQSLSLGNKEDIRSSNSTLCANGELSPLSALWIVDPRIAFFSPVPQSQQLPLFLVKFKVFSKLGRIFKISEWIKDVSEKIRKGISSEEERSALYDYIISKDGCLSRKTIPFLRELPILRDHEGRWVEPRYITLRNADGANQLKDILHFPHQDYEKNEELATLFRFRKSITGEDLILFARRIKASPELAPKFEKVLSKFHGLLNKNIVDRLKMLEFLRTSKGTIARPSSLYIPNQINQACLGPQAAFVLGSKIELYKKLGCLEHPKEEDIYEYILELSSQNKKPNNPEYLYEQFVRALKKEEVPLDYYRNENIIWNGKTYSPPSEVLIGLNYKRVFLDSIPIIPNVSKPLYDSYIALGVHRKPQLSHWNQFFLWIDKTYRESGNSLKEIEKYALQEAYNQLTTFSQLPTNVRFLDVNGKLHNLTEIQNESFVIDDNPQLSGEIKKLNLPISFAEVGKEGNIQFYKVKANVKQLTDISELTGYEIGEEKLAPHWFHQDKILQKLHDDYFIDAVKTLANYTIGTQIAITSFKLKTRLHSIKKIIFAEKLDGIYNVKNKSVPVPLNIVWQNNRAVLTEIHSKNDVFGLLSLKIAELFTTVAVEIRNLADSIFRLLTSGSTSEMKNYLYQRGITWEPQVISDSEELEYTFVDELFIGNQEAEQVGDILAEITQNLVHQSDKNSGDNTPSNTKPQNKPQQKPIPKPPLKPKLELPALENVSPKFIDATGNLKPRASRKKKGYSGNWHPPTPEDTAQDQLLGRRGEELVFREILKQVNDLGLDESQVVKTYETNPSADHDIRFVSEKGENVWVEVKSTTGRSGRFNWSKAEFEKALKERKNYVLWRVYEAHTATPTVKVYVDPISYLLRNQMRLDIADLHAEVEPLEKS